MVRHQLRRPLTHGRVLAALALGILLQACAAGPPVAVDLPGHRRALGSDESWLPEARWTTPEGLRVVCTLGMFAAPRTLAGSSTDPRCVWMVGPDGARTELGWDADTSVRFDPEAVVIGPDGLAIARAGTVVRAGCATAEPGVAWPELPAAASEGSWAAEGRW